MDRKLFRLTADYKDLKTGNLMMQGEQGDDGLEWFDMTAEMGCIKGFVYSYYNVPTDIMTPASDFDRDMVALFFKTNRSTDSTEKDIEDFGDDSDEGYSEVSVRLLLEAAIGDAQASAFTGSKLINGKSVEDYINDLLK